MDKVESTVEKQCAIGGWPMTCCSLSPVVGKRRQQQQQKETSEDGETAYQNK